MQYENKKDAGITDARKMDVNAPLASFVWLTVNGEEQGLYTALEDVSNSFLARIAGGKGAIYKPEDGEMGLNEEEMENIRNGKSAAHNNGNGADLVYKDDKEESYPDIFENAETHEDTENTAGRAACCKIRGTDGRR